MFFEEYHTDSVMKLYFMCIEVIVNQFYNTNFDQLKIFPPQIKDKLLSLMTRRNKLDAHVVKILTHKKTPIVDLSQIPVEEQMITELYKCFYLKELNLSADKNQPQVLSNPTLKNLFTHLPHLTVLKIRFSKCVNDEIMEKIAKSCPKLTILDLCQCSNIQDYSLTCLADLKRLISINLSATMITNEGVRNLVNGNSKFFLKEIHLSHCSGITDHAMQDILFYCPNIKILTFRGSKISSFMQETLQNKFALKQLFWDIF